MDWNNNLNISLNGNIILLLIGIVLIIAYTIFIYRTTLPKVSIWIKSILIFLRTLALISILILIFDIKLNFLINKKIEPATYIFIDNSKSIGKIVKRDSSNLVELINDLNSDLEGKKYFYLFGSNIRKLDTVNISQLNFNESSTNFTPILQKIKSDNNISSALILSDGIINQGGNPISDISNLDFPIYTLGIGDTSTITDVIVENITANSIIYSNKETMVEVLIRNIELDEKSANVMISENGQLLGKEKITLSKTGVNRVSFPYKTNIMGSHRLTIDVSTEFTETNMRNNSKSYLLNVLAAEKKIVLISGSPSSDFDFIYQIIKDNEEFLVDKIIEIDQGNLSNSKNSFNKIKDADIIFFIGFPGSYSNVSFIDDITNLILTNKKPLFFLPSVSIDNKKIKSIEKLLPFKYSSKLNTFLNDQVVHVSGNSIIGNESKILGEWSELPPINFPRSEISFKTYCNTLLRDKSTQSFPILFTSNLVGERRIVLNSANIWRWKLIAKNSETHLLDNLIINSIKWLALTNDDDLLQVRLNKNSFKLGEAILFNANLYDETLEPLSNQSLILEIFNDQSTEEYEFKSLGNGIYETEVLAKNPGVFNYRVTVKDKIINSNSSEGKVNIETIELEDVEEKANVELLSTLAKLSGGQYAYLSNFKNIVKKLNEEQKSKLLYKTTDKELRLSNLEFILIFIVLLFSIEWILRKSLKMI